MKRILAQPTASRCHFLRAVASAVGRHPQKGSGNVSVERVCNASSFVRVSHASPARILPMRPVGASYAASAMLGAYGGGMLGGDALDFKVNVGPKASLALGTQASTKVYRSKNDKQPAEHRLDCSVGLGGLLVVTPDPLVPYARSSYIQRLRFQLQSASNETEETASAVVVDWLGAGRIALGERWAFDSYDARAEYSWVPSIRAGALEDSKSPAPQLVEAMRLTSEDAEGSMGAFDTSVTVVATGPRASALAVAARLRLAASALAARNGARVAKVQLEVPVSDFKLPALSGRIVMGVTSTVPAAVPEAGSVTVARIMAQKTEDVYRLLQCCLAPLKDELGVVPYADRVHGSAKMGFSGIDSVSIKQPPLISTIMTLPRDEIVARPLKLSLSQQVALFQLTDATLPTGGFAHSAGLEAASQLGLLAFAGTKEHDFNAVKNFICESARSNLRLQGSFCKAAYRVGLNTASQGGAFGDESFVEEWKKLDSTLHSLLATNAVACKASMQQGSALARVASHWTPVARPDVQLPTRLRGHAATIFGLVVARLGLPEDESLYAFTYCNARDAVSAAVRLNLVGPMKGVELLNSIMVELTPELYSRMNGERDMAISHAAASAPLVDAAHAAHELLEARLFLT